MKKIISRNFKTINEEQIKSVSISLATDEEILEWSNGKVELPETINYKTYKPVPKGLFDEVIFGPMHDFKCSICNRKYKNTNINQKCEATEKCKLANSTILPKSTRRERMGHIKLEAPVVHYWFYKVDHSIIAKLLGLRTQVGNKEHIYIKQKIEDIISFKSHIVVKNDPKIKSLSKNRIIDINTAPNIYRDALKEIIDVFKQKKFKQDWIRIHGEEEWNFGLEELEESLNDHIENSISSIGKDYGIDFYELNEIIENYTKIKILTGPRAIEYLLENIDLKNEILYVKNKINNINKSLSKSANLESKKQERVKLYQRLQVLKAFKNSKQEPKNILIKNLPVIPADLRPLIQIDGGRYSTVDINELYRRIIIRNNRLKKWYDQNAPQLIIQNEWRMLQEAVNALIDNERNQQQKQITAKDNRPLKSLSSLLSGKKGRFRQNLLGKRVDYSGRSVIVVGPELKLHQVGIPRKMIAKLFEPWIINLLIQDEVCNSQKAAKKLIDILDPKIWPHVEKAIKNKIVLLNRAPSLHRLSFQAFEPVLVRGSVIKLHPLVTAGFNADFDGDQMAIHVPISQKAIREARELMLANRNILSIKDGEPIINPSQDIVIGIHYLTMERRNVIGEGQFFNDFNNAFKAYEKGQLNIHARIVINSSSINKPNIENDGYIITTIGKLIFNNAFPDSFPFIFDGSNETFENDYKKFFAKKSSEINKIINLELPSPLTKKRIAIISRKVYDDYNFLFHNSELAKLINKKSFISLIKNKNRISLFNKISSINDFNGNSLNSRHCKILENSLIKNFKKLFFKKLFFSNKESKEFFESDKIKLFEHVWFDYTNEVARIFDEIKNLGFKYSSLSGTTMSISDIVEDEKKEKIVKEGDDFVKLMKQKYEIGLLTDNERYDQVVSKWAEVKKEIEANLSKKMVSNINNSIFIMINSGARGNISNYVQLAGMRGIMNKNVRNLEKEKNAGIKTRTLHEVPIKNSFLNGLSSFEFYLSTNGARKGLTDTARNTANSGYLTRRLVDMAQNITIREEDCGTDNGSSIKSLYNSKTKAVIVPLEERIEGRFANIDIFDREGNIIIKRNHLITKEIIKKIKKAKLTSVYCRTIIGCQTRYGVCQKCFGKDLSTNRVVALHEPIGIIAAQSIGEPGTQLTMRTFHTGGVSGVEDITSGFHWLEQLIDAVKLDDLPENQEGIISEIKGFVKSIKKSKIKPNHDVITLVNKTNEEVSQTIEISNIRKKLVKKNDEVRRGDLIVDGIIKLHNLLEVAGPKKVQNYLIKEFQTLFRMQGINISDKYIEVIVRQMLSKIIIQDPGNSSLFSGSIIDLYNYRDEVKKQIAKGKKPPFGKIIIKGGKKLSLFSKSWLSAASYLETPKVLVHAAINNREDKLIGLKENVIIGHKIPAGTFKNEDNKGKFDIKDPNEYFSSKKPINDQDQDQEKSLDL